MANGSPLPETMTTALVQHAAAFCLRTGVRVEEATTFAADVVRTIGEVVDTMPIDQNLTTEDAIARVGRAQLGSLVTPDGAPLGVPHLAYLRALRNGLFVFTDAVEREIARIDTVRERGDGN